MLQRAMLGVMISLAFLGPALSAKASILDDGSLYGAGQQAGYDTVSGTNPAYLIGNIIKVVIGMLGVIFLILTIYAGITWMTAAGDSKKVDKAKGILVTSVVGLVIVLTSYAITGFVIDNLASSTTSAPTR